jgi:hypothetical protein
MTLVVERIAGVWPLTVERLLDATTTPQPSPRVPPQMSVIMGPPGPPLRIYELPAAP